MEELVPLGSGVISLNWTRRQRIQFVPGDGGRPRPQLMELGAGPTFKCIPRDQILWQGDCSLQDSDYVITQSLRTRGDLARLEQFNAIDTGYLDDLKPTTGNYTSSNRQSRKSLAGQGTFEPHDLYDIRQAWINWPTLRGLRFEAFESFDWKTPLLPLLVTFDATTGTVLRAQGKPYYTAGWPFYEGQFRGQAGRQHPDGIAKMLEHLQRAATTIINQAIDTNTLANSLNYVTSDPKMLTKRFVPGRPLYVEDLGQFKEVPLNKLTAPDMSLLQAVMAMAERITGISDPAMGRETRMGGHPSPATSTAMMLQESKEMMRATLRSIRLQMSRMAEDLVTLYQQFESGTSGKIERAIGAEDAAQIKSWRLPIGPVSGRISFDVKALDEHANPEAATQRAMQLMQMTANYWGTIIQATTTAAKMPPEAQQLIPQFIKSYTEAAKAVLDAGLVDEVEKYILQMGESQFGASDAISKLNTLAGDQLGGLAAARNGRALPPLPAGPQGLPLPPNGAEAGSGFPA